MKALVVLAVLSFGVVASAQEVRTTIPTVSSTSYKESGVKVALTYSSLNSTAKASGEKRSSDLGSGVGASLGYAQLPVKKIGYLGLVNFSRIDVDDSANDVNFLRLEANVAYAMNPRVFIKAGANVSDIVNREAKVRPGLGGQLGIGVRTTPTIGFEVNYLSMNQTNIAGPREVDLSESGLELGISGTF